MLAAVILALLPAHVDTAKSYTWVREVRPNRHPMIDTWNRFVGAPLGSPYCASFASWVLSRARVRAPVVRSAWSQAFRVGWSVPPSRQAMQPGSVLVWRRGSSGWQGHVGFLVRLDGDRMLTVEANTSPTERGTVRSQRDGDGVYVKTRSWKRNAFAGNAFRLVAVTHVVP